MPYNIELEMTRKKNFQSKIFYRKINMNINQSLNLNFIIKNLASNLAGS